MDLVLEKRKCVEDEKLRLYVVWIDVDMGDLPGDWEMNSSPQPLQTALAESQECNIAGFPTKITLEGLTPRPDGLFSNPETE